MSNVLETLLCPRCKLKAAFQICFGKRGYCFNCKHNWKLNWKGSKGFSTKVRLENV